MEFIIGIIGCVVIVGFYDIICIHRKVNEILDYLRYLKDQGYGRVYRQSRCSGGDKEKN